MRSNRYAKTVRIYGAKKSKKHYSEQNYRTPLQEARPKSRRNRKQEQVIYQNKSAQICARICLVFLLLIVIELFKYEL